MARQKKDGKYINFYMATDVLNALEIYAEEHGMTKTKVVEWALMHYIKASNEDPLKDGIQKPIV